MSQFSTPQFLRSLVAAAAVATAVPLGVASAQPAADATGPDASLQTNQGRVIRDGVVVDFAARPVGGGDRPLRAGEYADIEFRLSGADDGEPLQGVFPGVWIDLTETASGRDAGHALECRARVANYLQGLVGMRPLIDLNSYYVLALNSDPSISVIDPVVGISGITSLFANIPLARPGADWAKTSNEKSLYVSMPRADQVAIIDLDTFSVTRNIDAGTMPTRTVLQPDERYLWVGNNLPADETGGVTVIDTHSGKIVASIETGRGHHEIAVSADSRTVLVTNRQSGTVSAIDVARLEEVAEIETGPVPISLSYSELSDAFYVADGESGTITVIAAATRGPIARISAERGLGPMRFSEDGRWGIAVNSVEDLVYVIDASTNAIAHRVPVEGRPFHVSVTRTFAYIRAMDSERIAMLNLQELARGGDIIVNRFAAGTLAPSQANDIGIADPIAPAAQEAAVLVVSPADATVYYYMEGMNAPMGAFRNYGHKPAAVQIANRALKQTEPGVYSSTIRLPAAGKFEVAFLNETPRFMHCFTMEAERNPALVAETKPLEIEYLNRPEIVTAGPEPMTLRFRLTDPATGAPVVDLQDAFVRYYRAPMYGLTNVPAVAVGDGIYEAELGLPMAGSYYIYVAVPSRNAGYNDLRYLTLAVRRPLAQEVAALGDEK